MEMMQTSPVILERVGSFPLGMENRDFEDEGWMDDGDSMSRDGRGNIRSHLNDLAQRHPEFANTLQGPAWGERMWMGDEDVASGSQASSSSSDPRQEQEQSDEPGPLRGRPRNNLPQHGLRNTVPDMGQRQAEELKEEARGQRSWSAPPDSRLPREPQRFVSRVNINPINPEDGAGDAKHQPSQAQGPDNQGKPPPVPKPQQQQQQQPQQSKPASNVRHIPIFVEGRDEPILPKNIDVDSEPASYQQHFTSQAQHQFQPQSRPFPQQKRPFQTPQNNPPQQKQPNRSFNTSPKPFQQPNMNANFQQQPQQHQQQQQPHQPQQENVPTDTQPKTAERPQPRVANDPISRVQAIQKEIFALKDQVDKYSGNSRRDKDYVYLDEMLTRNLIKLDDIETDGKENIRQARKDAIRSIQLCINILEEKVPLPQETNQPMEEAQVPVLDKESGNGESIVAPDDGVAEAKEGPMDTAQEEAKIVTTPMDVGEKAECGPTTTDETIPNKEP